MPCAPSESKGIEEEEEEGEVECIVSEGSSTFVERKPT
jgi:hypothetical protein